MPRLSAFISEHSDEILDAWEAFARQLSASTTLDVLALRDHAQSMLNTIVADLESPETDESRVRKSKGLSDAEASGHPTAASEHGHARAEGGFSVEDTVAEFRALRASVITLWLDHQKQAGASELEDMRRFDEAIDQAIAESVSQFMREIDGTRERFLAVLGHDLKTPLSVILTSSRFLLEEGELPEQERTLIAGMDRSGRRMTELVDDLLAMALTRFGRTIPLRLSSMELGALVREIADEVGSTVRSARIEVETDGSLVGEWDRMRLAQALTNLVSNAVQHGTPGKPIRVAASGNDEKTVEISVTNEGPKIADDWMSKLFDEKKGTPGDRADRRHLGLGLYIVDKIIDAHGGSVDVRSSEDAGTTFTITIPRRPI